MIELKNLTKYYGKNRGIEDINLKVEKGEVFGFLGPNGAGKTTTIRLMLDLIRPTSGSAHIAGYDCNKEPLKVKELVEYLPGDFVAYNSLTCREYLRFMSGLYEDPEILKRAEELAKTIDLDLSRRIGHCSKGMKQKLGIIQTFMVDSMLYIVDEPTTGLDPLMQQSFYRLIDQQREKGKTIFMSSHILSEVERICDRVAIIREGSLIEVNSISNLKGKKFKEVKIIYESIPDKDFFDMKDIEVKSVDEDKKTVNLKITSNFGKNINHLTSVPVVDIHVTDPSLEEIFLSYYKGGDKQ